jgi:hypothetical protein
MDIVNQFRLKTRVILHEKHVFSPLIELIETKTKINREYLFYGK